MAKEKGSSVFMHYEIDDEYYTPDYAWQMIEDYLPKNKVIWEAFNGDGTSTNHLREMGCNVVSDPDANFFENNLGEIVVSNPPFSIKKEVLERLYILNKPFILIMPSHSLYNEYMRPFLSDMTLIAPRKRIAFISSNGELTKRCPFFSTFFCWKMGFKEQIIYL